VVGGGIGGETRCLSPLGIGGKRKGNRERASVPVWRKKREKREQRESLRSRLEGEEREKGTEREPPFPFEERREEKGSRERLSVPVWRKKREKREQRKALWYHLEEEESFTLSHLNKKAYFPQNSW